MAKAEPTLAGLDGAGKLGRLDRRPWVGDGEGTAGAGRLRTNCAVASQSEPETILLGGVSLRQIQFLYPNFGFQGSIASTPHPSKSAEFRVASVARRERATAAIAASKALIGRPARRRVAAMSA